MSVENSKVTSLSHLSWEPPRAIKINIAAAVLDSVIAIAIVARDSNGKVMKVGTKLHGSAPLSKLKLLRSYGLFKIVASKLMELCHFLG